MMTRLDEGPQPGADCKEDAWFRCRSEHRAKAWKTLARYDESRKRRIGGRRGRERQKSGMTAFDRVGASSGFHKRKGLFMLAFVVFGRGKGLGFVFFSFFFFGCSISMALVDRLTMVFHFAHVAQTLCVCLGGGKGFFSLEV